VPEFNNGEVHHNQTGNIAELPIDGNVAAPQQLLPQRIQAPMQKTLQDRKMQSTIIRSKI
jgi:hypothetical protein